MTNCNLLEEKFLNGFFLYNKFMDAKTAITIFTQGSTKKLSEAWECYKSMLRKFSNHGFNDLTHIHIFRNGLQPQPKLLLDATACVSLMSKSVEDTISIINRMSLSDHHIHYNRGSSQKKARILELGTNDATLAQNKLLTQTMENSPRNY